jgi:hypothetical protein
VKQKLADIILDEKYNVPNAGKKQPTIWPYQSSKVWAKPPNLLWRKSLPNAGFSISKQWKRRNETESAENISVGLTIWSNHRSSTSDCISLSEVTTFMKTHPTSDSPSPPSHPSWRRIPMGVTALWAFREFRCPNSRSLRLLRFQSSTTQFRWRTTHTRKQMWSKYSKKTEQIMIFRWVCGNN